MTYLDDAAIREQMYHAYAIRATSGEHDNRASSADPGAAQEKARLLGFADFADLVLDDRMAHTGDRAQEFLEDLRAKTEPRFREENAELQRVPPSIEGPARRHRAMGCRLLRREAARRAVRFR